MNILTFDIEDWFHILDNDSTKTVKEWGNYEIRSHKNMERIIYLLEKHNIKATFFCLGWIAKQYPEIIKSIDKLGYEIGSHSFYHQLVYEQTKKDFNFDVERSIKIIEDIIGKKVRIYRAPGFSITEQTKWAFEILAENGISIDCSIFPSFRSHGGFPSYNSSIPSLLRYNGIELKELPINFKKVFSTSIIFSGGGYFRLFPYFLINRWTRRSDYIMSYMHPRDFDPFQPMIKDLTITRKFKSYVNLRSTEKKLNKWLDDFEFIDVETAIKLIEWEKVPVVNL